MCDTLLVCGEKVELLNAVREHVLRLEDKQQELKAKLLKMTASLEAAREEHKVTKSLRWRRWRRRRQCWEFPVPLLIGLTCTVVLAG